ncbi:unnamed protein product [Polarella glacialis]|uniref:Pentatricopeptide repeat-containing protein, chloroplastic n=1 Tax=Polarella glacialis TaxID=89957 RepID=A0A813IH90_POLGL|nr:unnamed protein product [Polarella glacialis]
MLEHPPFANTLARERRKECALLGVVTPRCRSAAHVLPRPAFNRLASKTGGKILLPGRQDLQKISGSQTPRDLASAIGKLGGQSLWGQALSHLRSWQKSFRTTPQQAYNAAISACGRGRQIGFAIAILREMWSIDALPDVVSYGGAISACEKAGRWESALFLLAEMLDLGVPPDTAVFNQAISACEKGGCWESALEILWRMWSIGVVRSEVTFGAAISACEKGKQWEQALVLLDEVWDHYCIPNAVIYNAAISACGGCGRWGWALQLLTGMAHDTVELDVVTFSAAIAACGASQEWQRILALLEQMGNGSLSPNQITYGAAISGVSSSQWALSLVLLRDMPRHKLKPDPSKYGATLLALLAADKWKLALRLQASILAEDGGSLDMAGFAAVQTESEQRGLLLPELSLLPHLGAALASRRSRSGSVRDAEAAAALGTAIAQLRRQVAVGQPPRPADFSRSLQRVLPVPKSSFRTSRLPSERDELYSKELSLLQHVLHSVDLSGGAPAICGSIEDFGERVLGSAGLWLKVAGGVKAHVLAAAVRGAMPFANVLEIGAYCGYSSLRMATLSPMLRIDTLEADPLHVAIARSMVALAGLSERVHVWTGHSGSLIPRMAVSLRSKFGVVFMDQRGSRYEEDLGLLEGHELLETRSVVVADNVLKPGAPVFLWRVCCSNDSSDLRYATKVLSMQEFAMPAEDWMSVTMVQNDPELGSAHAIQPPPQLLDLVDLSDRVRARATGRGAGVSFDDWAAFADSMRAGLAKVGVLAWSTNSPLRRFILIRSGNCGTGLYYITGVAVLLLCAKIVATAVAALPRAAALELGALQSIVWAAPFQFAPNCSFGWIRSWPPYVVSWAKADLAIAAPDFRAVFAVGVAGSNLQVTAFDGLRPNTVFDIQLSDISGLPSPVQAKKATSRGALDFTSALPPRPIALALAASLEDDGHEFLLVLLSSGHLLGLSTVRLGVELILGFYSEVSDGSGAGSALAVLREIGWVIVAAGSQLGLASVDACLTEGAGSPGVSGPGSKATFFDLPKGLSASMLLAYPGPGLLLLVGCSNSRLLLYSSAVSYKGQANRLILTLVQTLDITGAIVNAGSLSTSGFRDGMSRLFTRRSTPPRSPSTSPSSTAGHTCIEDAFALVGGSNDLGDPRVSGPELLVASGSSPGRTGSTLSVWQVFPDDSRDSSPSPPSRSTTPGPAFKHLAVGSSPTPILRVLLLSPGRLGRDSAVVLSVDAKGDITLWTLRLQQIVPLSMIPGCCSFEMSSARTFGFAGSLYLLVSYGSRSTAEIGWLDMAALLDSAGVVGSELAQPFSGRSCSGNLRPPFRLDGLDEGTCNAASGGEVFFVSGTSVRCYRADSGRTSVVHVTLGSAASVTDWLPVGVLDVLTVDDRMGGSASHLLVAVREEVRGIDGGDTTGNAVWLLSLEGKLIARMPGAIDAVFLGSKPDAPRVAWLALKQTGSVRVNVAPTCQSGPGGELQASSFADADGIERILGMPASFNGVAAARLPLYWGSRLPGGPLRLAGHDGLKPAGEAALQLPSCGPRDLVDARWNGPKLALASPFAVWVVLFQSRPTGTRADQMQVSLLAWLDLRATLGGAGRALSLAWLTDHSPADAPCILLLSTPCGISAWAATSVCRPKSLALYERPQLVVGALLDRLISVEFQTGVSVFAGHDVLGGDAGMEAPIARSAETTTTRGSLAPRPRARVRARPLSFFEALEALGALAAIRPSPLKPEWAFEADWRLAPPSVLPATMHMHTELSSSLWKAALCSEAPPQLRDSAAVFQQMAVAAGDEFRALVAVTTGLGSFGSGRSRGDAAADEARVASQLEDSMHLYRSSPARADMLHCAAGLLVDCASNSSASDSDPSLSILCKGITKHDMLPLGVLTAGCLAGSSTGSGVLEQFPLLLALPVRRPEGQVTVLQDALASLSPLPVLSLCGPAPFLDAVLRRVTYGVTAKKRPPNMKLRRPDFSASAMLRQQYSETPLLRRPTQIIQPQGHQVCQLHTATVMQWLGLGSTQLQVRVFKAIQSEAEGSPANHAKPSDSLQPATQSAAVLPNGVLVYWRCADGEGNFVRDSAGCGRAGRLSGAITWRGPLQSDDPLETSDEWGQELAPNFALVLGGDCELRYSPAGLGSEDRQMLSLLGGNRSDGAGQRHLMQALENGEGADLATDAGCLSDGWTVELWIQLPESQGDEELLLFSRRPVSGGVVGPAALSWYYRPKPSSFRVLAANESGGSLQVLAGACEALPQGWVHLALRSDLKIVEIWVNSKVVLRSSPETVTQMLSVPVEADLCFGPAPGLELTEVRVWGVFRSDSDLLQNQRQSLHSLLQHEMRAEAWKKVKIRSAVPASSNQVDSGAGLGSWGLEHLSKPNASEASRQQPGRQGLRLDRSSVPKSKEAGSTSWGGAEAWPAVAFPDFPTAPAWGQAPVFGVAPVPAVAPRIPDMAGFAAGAPVFPKASSVSGTLKSAVVSGDSLQQSFGSQAARRHSQTLDASNTSSSSGGSSGVGKDGPSSPSSASSSSSDDDVLHERSPRVTPPAPPPAPVTPSVLDQRPQQPMGRLMQGIMARRQTEALKSAVLDRQVPPAGRSLLLPASAPDVASLPQFAPTSQHPFATLPSEAPSLPAKALLPSLHETLPAPGPGDGEGALAVVDTSFRVATEALERHAYSFASAAFRAVLPKLLQHLSTGAGASSSVAVRSRIEAAVSYMVLCALLQEIQDLKPAATSSPSATTLQAQRNLCERWACVLRVAKAPRDTVRLAMQAMATFFALAKPIGGWIAARQVAGALLEHCDDFLAGDERSQVEYVVQATEHGTVARGASGGVFACGACPSCRAPVEALAPICASCEAELVVDVQERRLCDARASSVCTLCAGVFGHTTAAPARPDGTPTIRRGGPQSHSVRAAICPVCGVGELRPRRLHGIELAF